MSRDFCVWLDGYLAGVSTVEESHVKVIKDRLKDELNKPLPVMAELKSFDPPPKNTFHVSFHTGDLNGQ